jgi:methyltransferase family protein
MSVVQYINRSIQLPADASTTDACVNGPHDLWQMLDSERAALSAIVSWLRPQCAIEIGVFRAGSLGVIAAHSQRVYALDLDPACELAYRERFPNVEFVTGPSSQTLPVLLERIQASGTDVDFVLIDADHSEAGVRSDIDNLLRYRPAARPLYVLMHDSFNPGCRNGMKTASWAANPHVHAVELDFVIGTLGGPGLPPSFQRTMWCGLALAILLPERRVGELRIEQRELWGYEAAYRQSVHRRETAWSPRYSFPRLTKSIRREGGRWLSANAPAAYAALRTLRDRGRRRTEHTAAVR